MVRSVCCSAPLVEREIQGRRAVRNYQAHESRAHQDLNPTSITNWLTLTLFTPSYTKSSENTYVMSLVCRFCVSTDTLTYLFAHTYTHARVCECRDTHATVHVWPSEDSLRCLPSLSTRDLFTQHSWLGSLQRFSISHPTIGTRITGPCYLAPGFM